MADLILMNMIHLDKVSHLYQGDLLTAQLPNFYFHYLHNVSVSYQNLVFFVKVIFSINITFMAFLYSFLSHRMIIQVFP